MTTMIWAFSLLLVLTAEGGALSCTQCESDTSSSCSGSIVTCPSYFWCGSSYSEVIAGGIKVLSFVRSCARLSICNFTGSVGLQKGRVRTANTCCNSDNCTPTRPTLPAINSTRNGLTCRYCTSTATAWCLTSDTVDCTGNQNRCLLQTTKQSGLGATAIRGCSTKSFCDLGSRSQIVGEVTTDVNFICTDAGRSVHEAVWTPAITSLLLIKFFS